MLSFKQWAANSKRVPLYLQGRRLRLATHRFGDSEPHVTLLHGFPTSSYDWIPLIPSLSESFSLLSFDFLGFGNSDKPEDYDYGTVDRADQVVALWRHFGIQETFILAHDFSNSVVLELLWRQKVGILPVKIRKVALLNGGIFAKFHRPVFIQRLLMMPVWGRILSSVYTEGAFRRQMRKILSRSIHDLELRELWRGMIHRRGIRNFHKLIHYITDRLRFRSRWEPMILENIVPIKLIWGEADPVSGAHVLEEIRRLKAPVEIRSWSDVGHYPQLENPAPVADEARAFFLA